jgi:hypothetical protein
MFCTRQNSFHCPSTLSLPRKVKRSSPCSHIDSRIPAPPSQIVGRIAHDPRGCRFVASGDRCNSLEASIEAGQINLVFEQVIECVFEGAGDQLPLQINGEKSWAGVDVFVAGHARLFTSFLRLGFEA